MSKWIEVYFFLGGIYLRTEEVSSPNRVSGLKEASSKRTISFASHTQTNRQPVTFILSYLKSSCASGMHFMILLCQNMSCIFLRLAIPPFFAISLVVTFFNWRIIIILKCNCVYKQTLKNHK